MYITDQDLINWRVKNNAPKTDAAILKDLIELDRASIEKSDMEDGHNYYGCDNDILSFDFRKYKDKYGETKIQENKANNRLAHGFHRLLVIQKVAYLLNNPVIIQHKNKKVTEEVTKTLGKQFNDKLITLATGASNKGKEIMFVYPDASGKLNFVIADSRQCIPIYDTSTESNLVQFIRYYSMDYDNGSEKWKGFQAQWWDATNVRIYDQDKNGDFYLTEEKGHFQYEDTQFNTKEAKGWGAPPFIELLNNPYSWSDLKFIKSLVDAYDKGESSINNNLEDIQEAIIVAMGFSQKPEEIRDNLRNYKVVSTPDSGEHTKLDSLEIQIPFEARDRTAKTLEENIFTFGMGLNPKNDSFGQNASGVALKWLYLPLDLKAGMLERKFDDFLYKLMWFINEFNKLQGKTTFDVNEFTFTFKKSMISNEQEIIQNLVDSKDMISDETILANHPYIDDVDREKELLQQQRENEFNSYKTDLSDNNKDDLNNADA